MIVRTLTSESVNTVLLELMIDPNVTVWLAFRVLSTPGKPAPQLLRSVQSPDPSTFYVKLTGRINVPPITSFLVVPTRISSYDANGWTRSSLAPVRFTVS